MNQITIIGNLGADPELRYTKNGRPLVTLSVATTRKAKEETETVWHHVECWAELAENCAASLVKGTRIMVTGRMDKQEFTTSSGEQRTKTLIVANEVAVSLVHQSVSVERNVRS